MYYNRFINLKNMLKILRKLQKERPISQTPNFRPENPVLPALPSLHTWEGLSPDGREDSHSPGIRSNFGEMFTSKLSPLPKCGKQDSLPHIRICEVLTTNFEPKSFCNLEKKLKIWEIKM